MKDSEFQRFGDVVNGVMDVYGRERSPTAVALWWKVLQRYTLAEVESALAQHMRVSRFAPTPADVTALISDRDGRPGADEAWAMIPRSEAESVIWTEEMAHAYGVAGPLLQHGDPIAARKAFLEAYEGAVTKARLSGIAVKITPSWGADEASRASAVRQAVDRGLLTPAKAQSFLAALPNYAEEVAATIQPLLAGTMRQLPAETP